MILLYLSSKRKFPVVIMAGTDINKKDELLEFANVNYKTLITINGKTILERILKALYDSNRITRYYIVGVPKAKITLPKKINPSLVTFIESEGFDVPDRIAITTERIIEDAKNDETILADDTHHLLFVTGDIPFITGDIINEFLDKCGDLSFDMYPSCVSKDIMVSRFPKSSRTYGKLREGRYCLGDISLFRVGIVGDRVDKIRILRENRKKFVRTIFKLQPFGVFRYILGRLSFDHLNKATSKIFDVQTKFIPMERAEIAMDIDKPHQLEMAIEELIDENNQPKLNNPKIN